jgi:hypothetical protein
MSILKVLKDCSTDEYGAAYDLVALCALIGFMAWVIYEGISFFTGKAFNGTEYGLAFGGVMTVVTTALRFKPKAIPPTDSGVQS